MKVILLIVTVFSIPFLTGCIDLSLDCCTGYDEPHAVTDLAVVASCEDDLEGVVAGSLARGVRNGSYPMSPILMGLHPLATWYDCEFHSMLSDCCARVHILGGETKVEGHMGCGSQNPCGHFE